MNGRIVALEHAEDAAFGGKARGLARLIAAGFAVPAGFVWVAQEGGEPPAELERHASRLGERVAVRSSALAEDGATRSFAGQLETLLNVPSRGAELWAAVQRCLASATSDRVRAYAGEGVATGMAVVVQRMIEPCVAGVLFSVDPVSGRRDRMVIDAVRGLGERLVGGEATPEHVVVGRGVDRLAIVAREGVEGGAIVDDGLALRLAGQALAIEARLGHVVDLEWAVDGDGAIHWLQARPITALAADPRELDTEPPHPGDHYTRSNIGEMLPGVVTPLTASVTARGIDVGLQRMLIALGIDREETAQFRFVGVFSGQLFLNLTSLAKLGTHVAGASAERMCQSICGRTVDELEPGPIQPALDRARRAIAYGRYLASARTRPRRLAALSEGLSWERHDDALSQWSQLERAMPALFEAYEHHLASSALSGALSPALLEIASKGKPATDREHARVAELMAGASDVESADIASGAERVAAAIVEADREGRFGTADVEDAVRFLTSDGPISAREAFAGYLVRHGHRAVRELELREPSWQDDPSPLVRMLQASVRARQEARAPRRDSETSPGSVRPPVPLPLRPLVAWARAGVRYREATKSLLVRMSCSFKAAYRHLGALLAARGALPDPDAVFFLTHEELGRAARGTEGGFGGLAAARRRALSVQAGLVFPTLFRGRPEPVWGSVAKADGCLTGRPVSAGVAVGRACVVRTLAEAEAIQPGDILVAPITDVGWTPYFAAIAGLVTDLGSAVSHGAVVAREVGLPCVVNTAVGTSTFRTGDVLRLDGTRGTVELVRRA